MTAQPYHYSAGPIDRPRTVGAIRAALPPQLRERFQAALDDADPSELFELVARWAAVAQTTADPDVDTAVAEVRAGTAEVVELDEVFPALAELR
jgi:hypothetical protein